MQTLVQRHSNVCVFKYHLYADSFTESGSFLCTCCHFHRVTNTSFKFYMYVMTPSQRHSQIHHVVICVRVIRLRLTLKQQNRLHMQVVLKNGGSVSSLWMSFSTASCLAQFSSSSTFVLCCIRGPVKPSDQLSPPYNLTEQEPLAACLVGNCPRMKEAGRHHIEAAWNGKQFRVKIDGLAFQTCNVKPSVVSPPPHATCISFLCAGND